VILGLALALGVPRAQAAINIIDSGTTLQINNDLTGILDGFLNPGGVTLNGGVLLTNNALNLSFGAPFSTLRTLTINTTGGTLAATTGTTATYNGAITNGNGSTGLLTVGGNLYLGTVVFTAANSYSGGMLVDAATLQVTGAGTLGATTGTLAVTAGGTLDLDGTHQTVGAVTLGTGGSTLISSSGTAILTTTGVTVNDIGNTIGSGVTVVGNIAQSDNSALTVSGTVGADSLGASAALNGTGTIGAVTLSSNDTVTSSGTLQTAGITINGVGNSVSGAETATGGVTVAVGGAVTQAGTLTGALVDDGQATLNGTLAGDTTVASGGSLNGSGTVDGTTSVTTGTVNGSGLDLTGGVTFHGAANVLSGTETAAVTLAAGATVTQSGTLTGNVDLDAGGAHLTGTGTVGAVTLNGGGNTLASGATLTTGGLGVNGAGNTISSGTIIANATLAGGAALADNGTLSGTVNVGNGTLSGSGIVSGAATVTGGTVSGSGLDLAGGATFNGAANVLSGTETGAVSVATGATLSQSGTLTGNITLGAGATTLTGTGTVGTVALNGGGNTLSSGATLTTGGVTVSGSNNTIGAGTVVANTILAGGASLADNGALTGTVNVGNGTLSGSGSVSGAVSVAGGKVSGTGLALSSGVTFTGAGNVLSGTETGAVSLAAGAGLSQSGTLTGTVNLAAGASNLTGTGTVGVVTLNGGGATLGSGSTLTTAGITVNGASNTLAAGIVGGNATMNSGSTLTDNATLNGSLSVGSGLLNGTGAVTGAVTVGAGGGIDLQDGSVGTLTVGSLTIGNAGTASTLTFDVGASVGVNDEIQDNGTLTLTGTNGTTIHIGNATGTTSLADGTYTLVASTGLTGNVADLTLDTDTLDGKVLSLSVLNNAIDLTVATSATPVGTNYTLTTTAGADRIMAGQSTTLVTTITNVGSGPADQLNYSGLGATGTGVSGATSSGGPLANDGGVGTNSGQIFTGGATGAQAISPTVGSATNANLGTGATGMATGATVDVLANRTESATSVALGRVLVGQTTGSQTTTISSVTGDDDSLTRITLGASAQSAGVTNGSVTLAGGTAYQFGGANDSMNSTTRGVTGTFTAAGLQSGTAVFTPTGEGLVGEAVNPIDVAYTADAVNPRTITNGATTDLGTLHNGSAVNITSNSFTTSGLHATTTSVEVAAGTGVADANGITLSGSATTFNGSTSTASGSQTFGGTIAGNGIVSGAFDLDVITLENGGAGLTGEGAYSPVVVAYTADIYSGQGVYVGTGGGTYGTITSNPNFSASGGVPGLDPNFTTTDSATFGNSIGATTATVTLDGDSPSLNTITFDNTDGGSYNLAQGTGGTLLLNDGTGGTAQIDNDAGSNTISAPVELESDTAINVASGELTISGVISQSGGSQGLTVNGPGTMTLSGANTYSGGTTLNSGTLDISGSGTLGASTGPLNINGGVLDLGGTTQMVGAVGIGGASTIQDGTLNGTSYLDTAPSGTVVISANLTGSGSLTQSGGGTLALNGNNTYSGGTMISAGTVQVGHLHALGNGDVSMSGGTLETGNGVHVINVAGNYTQSGGTLVLNVTGTAPGADPGYEYLHVGGVANLGGTLLINVSSPFVGATGTSFTFVQAGSITGGFNQVQTNLYSLSVTQQGSGLIVNQLPFATLPGVPYTPNESNIAQSIDGGIHSGVVNSNFSTLVSALNGLTGAGSSPSALANAMSELSPDKFASFAGMTQLNQAVFDTQAMDQYLDSRRDLAGNLISNGSQIDTGGLTIEDPSIDSGLNMIHSQLLAWNPAPFRSDLEASASDSVLAGTEMTEINGPLAAEGRKDPVHFFVNGDVVLAQGFSQGDVPHFDSTTGSVRLGGDYQFGPNFLAGLLFDYSHTSANLDDQGSTATVDSYSPGIYASYASGGWYVNGLASYSRNQYQENRQIAFLNSEAKGSPSGYQINGSLTGGYDIHANNWIFGPTLGVQYTHLNVEGFTESGSPGDLTVADSNSDSLRGLLGARVSYEVTAHGIIFHPYLSASWQHEFLDQSRGVSASLNAVGGGSFEVQTNQPSRDAALIDWGMNVDLDRTITIFGDYIVQAGQDDYFAQLLQAGVRIGF
jgi:uncharacterized protein YhjY with autotransporter beta-barrel domain